MNKWRLEIYEFSNVKAIRMKEVEKNMIAEFVDRIHYILFPREIQLFALIRHMT